mmetsp:Transcript_10791/g.28445  ORF Transcript_10791/g.28445 Transcript_10791/m.28445 type:complete len:497 (-) Transcript_10791:1148-2638(-)
MPGVYVHRGRTIMRPEELRAALAREGPRHLHPRSEDSGAAALRAARRRRRGRLRLRTKRAPRRDPGRVPTSVHARTAMQSVLAPERSEHLLPQVLRLDADDPPGLRHVRQARHVRRGAPPPAARRAEEGRRRHYRPRRARVGRADAYLALGPRGLPGGPRAARRGRRHLPRERRVGRRDPSEAARGCRGAGQGPAPRGAPGQLGRRASTRRLHARREPRDPGRAPRGALRRVLPPEQRRGGRRPALARDAQAPRVLGSNDRRRRPAVERRVVPVRAGTARANWKRIRGLVEERAAAGARRRPVDAAGRRGGRRARIAAEARRRARAERVLPVRQGRGRRGGRAHGRGRVSPRLRRGERLCAARARGGLLAQSRRRRLRLAPQVQVLRRRDAAGAERRVRRGHARAVGLHAPPRRRAPRDQPGARGGASARRRVADRERLRPGAAAGPFRPQPAEGTPGTRVPDARRLDFHRQRGAGPQGSRRVRAGGHVQLVGAVL